MKIFETQRLTICKIKEEDLPAFMDFHNDAATMAYISSGKAIWNKEELNSKLRINLLLYPAGFGIYAIQLKVTGETIGEASVFNTFDDLNKPEIGYIISRKYWNQQYGTEVVNGLIVYCRDILKVDKVIARMYAENIFSAKICEKAGMQLVENTPLENGRKRLTYQIIFHLLT